MRASTRCVFGATDPKKLVLKSKVGISGGVLAAECGAILTQVLRVPPMKIEIDIPARSSLLKDAAKVLKRYPISTAKNGPGEKNGSFCTPRGRHIVRAKIGAGTAGQHGVRAPPADRRGLEPGSCTRSIPDATGCSRASCGSRAASRHATASATWTRCAATSTSTARPSTAEMGKPGSIGCIRMRNRDIVELFELVPPYTPKSRSGPEQS